MPARPAELSQMTATTLMATYRLDISFYTKLAEYQIGILLKMARYKMKVLLPIILILIVGSFIRLQNLDKLSMSHPEFYVPGIEIPTYMTDPTQRSTIVEVIAAPFKIHHPHLPGHDLLMLGWTNIFGTDISWMRASSALTGIFTLLIFYFYGKETTNNKTSLLAVFILALHGHHIFWSQMAKQWVLLALLGVLSSYLVSRLYKNWSAGIGILYCGCCIFGLWVDSYFWPVFAAQMLWVFLNNSESKYPPVLLNIQFVALLFAGPALSYLIYFSRLHSHLSPNIFPRVLEMVQFGGILIADSMVKPILSINLIIGLFGAFLLSTGLGTETQNCTDTYAPSQILQKRLWRTMVIVTLLMLPLNYMLFMNDSILNWTRYFLIGLFLPITATLLWLFFIKKWSQISLTVKKACSNSMIQSFVNDLPTMMVVIPFLILLLIHFTSPVLASFALISLSPFFILVACRGIFRLDKVARPFVIVATTLLCLFSIYQYANIPNANDYKALANSLKPQIVDGDFMLVDNEWFINPIVYYFPPSSYAMLPTKALLDKNSGVEKISNYSRYWLIDFLVDEDRKKIFESNILKLSSKLREVKRVHVNKGIAVLFERNESIK